MKWVTRENVHVDRVACPWLIRRFVDSHASFLFVPPEKIPEAEKDGAREREDDHEAIEKQTYLYDSLYAYCQLQLVKQKYANEIEKLEPKQRREFLKSKVKENKT